MADGMMPDFFPARKNHLIIFSGLLCEHFRLFIVTIYQASIRSYFNETIYRLSIIHTL